MAILKYRERFVGMSNFIYEETTSPFKRGKYLQKDEARKKIAEQNLVKVFRDEEGNTIWDTLDEPLFKNFQGQSHKIIDL